MRPGPRRQQRGLLPGKPKAGLLAFGFWLALEAPATLAQAPSPARLPLWAAMPASPLPMRLPVDNAPDWTLQGSAGDFEAVDATPVRDLSGSWDRYTPRGGRNAALQSARIELKAERSGWEIASVLRSDLLISGPRSSFDLVHAFKQRLTPPGGSQFELDVADAGAVWAGLRGAHTWTLGPASGDGLRLSAAFTLLSARRVQQVDVNGRVQYDAIDGYTIQAQALRQDSHQQFGGYGHKDATGGGYSADLGLLWQPSADTFVNVSAVDLFSRLKVNGVSTQQLTADSSTASLDANGYVNYAPLVTGRNESASVNMKLLRKWSASFGHRWSWADGEASAGGRWERIGRVDLPAVWADLPLWPGWQLQLDGELRFRTLGIGLRTGSGSLMLRTRSLPWGRSQGIGWQAGFTLPL